MWWCVLKVEGCGNEESEACADMDLELVVEILEDIVSVLESSDLRPSDATEIGSSSGLDFGVQSGDRRMHCPMQKQCSSITKSPVKAAHPTKTAQ
mgnify:CR=1 FL=1